MTEVVAASELQAGDILCDFGGRGLFRLEAVGPHGRQLWLVPERQPGFAVEPFAAAPSALFRRAVREA